MWGMGRRSFTFWISIMKMRFIFLAMAVSLAQGCASQHAGHGNTKEAAKHEKAAEKKELCPAEAEPSVACSQTATATFDSNGTLWLAWVNGEHIYVQSSPDQGKTYSAPVMVNKAPEAIVAHDEYRPKILLDKQGVVYLTWTQNLEKRHTGHIRFSRSVDGGKSFSEPVIVNDNLDVIGHRFDTLAVSDDGRVFVAWLDARDKERAKAEKQEHLGSSIYYAWSDDRGASFHPNQIVTPHTCECCRLASAIDSDNLPVLIWRHVFPGSIRDHALAKFQDWQTPGSVTRLGEENWKIDACPHHGPSLSVTAEGKYHAVWFSGSETKPGLFYAYSEDKGQTFSPAMPFGGAGAKRPNVGAAGEQVAITWLEFDGTNTLVKLQRSGDGGRHWSEAKTVAETAGSADYAFIVADKDVLYLSWLTRQGYRLLPLDSL